MSKITELFKGKLIGNSFWAILSSVFQNIIFSIFFIVIARRYGSTEFSSYIIANTLYGLLLSFSSLGLSQWFIRELKQNDFRPDIISRFFRIQLIAGLVFYFINVLLSFLLYDSDVVRNISLLLGVNIIFDNIIYVFKTINISSYQQKRNFVLSSLEAFVKLLLAVYVLYFDIEILSVTAWLVCLRISTLMLFFRFGLVNKTSFMIFLNGPLQLTEIGRILKKNIYFVVIGSVSVVYWSTGSLLVSKMLQFESVADYEISFKLFSMAEIIPVMVSASVFPLLVEKGKSDIQERNSFFRKVFLGHAIYGLLAFTFIYSYASLLIPSLFGKQYIQTASFCIQMFLTIVIFPTALLQANVLVSLHMEKTDMWLNLASLVLNVIICIFGLSFFKSLSTVNYAIFISFLFFHIFQDIVLVKQGISKPLESLLFYASSAVLLLTYHFIATIFSSYFFFFIFWIIFGLGIFIYRRTTVSVQSITA